MARKAEQTHAHDYVARGEYYANAVIKGRILAGKYTKLAAKRFLNDLKRSKTKRCKFYFSPWHANDACDFIEKLQHIEGEWSQPYKLLHGDWVRQKKATKPRFSVSHVDAMPPLETGWWTEDYDGWQPLEKKAPDAVYIRAGVTVLVNDDPYIVLEDAQIFWLINIYGFRRKSNDLRRFTQFYIELARKNAKSTLLAGIKLYCLVCEGEKGPQIWSGATTFKQARIVFDIGRKMVLKDRDLQEAFQLEVLANSIVCHMNGGFWQAIHSKAETQDGLNPHVAGLDEVHAHKTPALFNVLKSAFGARKAPLMALITTAGYILEGIGYSTRSTLIKILKGVLKMDHIWGVVYTIDEGDDPYDPKVWGKSNPLLGVSVTVESISNNAMEAKDDPLKQGEFETKVCNLWLNAANSLINMRLWEGCADPDMQLEDFAGCEWRLGADLADFDDIASVVLAVEKNGIEHWFDYHFLPEDLVKERAETVTSHYAAWAKEGQLILTDGDWIDAAFIEQFIRDKMDELGLCANEEPAARFDQYGSAVAMVGRLHNDNYPVEVYSKNAKNYTNPTKQLLARIKTKRFRHKGNPVLRWMASNVVGDFRTDGSVLPKKETKHSKNKIDGIDAGLLATSFLTDVEEDTGSVFDDGPIWDEDE